MGSDVLDQLRDGELQVHARCRRAGTFAVQYGVEEVRVDKIEYLAENLAR